jgi:hypothetical protein
MQVAQRNGAGLWEFTGLQPYVQLVAENATCSWHHQLSFSPATRIARSE